MTEISPRELCMKAVRRTGPEADNLVLVLEAAERALPSTVTVGRLNMRSQEGRGSLG